MDTAPVKALASGMIRPCLALFVGLICGIASGREMTGGAGQGAGTDIARVMATDVGRGSLPRENRCGVDALFVLMRLYGLEAGYEALQERMPITPAGVSMSSIRDCGRAHGLPLTPIRCTPENLHTIPLPAIAQLEPTSLDPSKHFVVVHEVMQRPDMVEVIDGSLLTRYRLPRDEFNRVATGYYLVKERSRIPSEWVLPWIIGGGVLILLAARSRVVRPAAVLSLSLTLLSGCQSKDPAASHAPSTSPLKIDRLSHDFGVIGDDKQLECSFLIENPGDTPLELSLGTPTGGCVRAELQPAVPVPSGESCRLVLRLDAATRPAGLFVGTVMVGAKGHAGTVSVSVRGLIEGVVHKGRYTLGPRDFSRGALPPLEFDVITLDASVPELTSVVCRTYPKHAVSVNDAAKLNAKEMWPLSEQLHFVASPHAVPESSQNASSHWSHHFRLTATCEVLERSEGGLIDIAYVVAGASKQDMIPYSIVAPSTFSTPVD